MDAVVSWSRKEGDFFDVLSLNAYPLTEMSLRSRTYADLCGRREKVYLAM